ncbi:MAG: hypothetical protein ACR2QF_06135, partial [Geminicoccaceae bacterium]
YILNDSSEVDAVLIRAATLQISVKIVTGNQSIRLCHRFMLPRSLSRLPALVARGKCVSD